LLFFSRTAFGERPVNQLAFDVSCIEAEDSSNEDFGSTNLSGVYRAFAPVLPSPSNAKYQARAERFVVTQQVQGQLFVESSAPGGPVYIEILSPMPKDKYAVDKASNVIDAKCERMAKFAAQCREANPEISEWSTPLAGSSVVIRVYIFTSLHKCPQIREFRTMEIVRSISEDMPLSDHTASLLLDDERGTVVKLDLSRAYHRRVHVRSWYYGYILYTTTNFCISHVALFGSFESGDRFIASRQFFLKPLPLSPLDRPSVDEISALWCASGPFTTSENCSYEQLRDLLEMVAKEQPHVLILVW
ncbi:hypothetical protein COOONC_10118, partial [Cooperia oncophora]